MLFDDVALATARLRLGDLPDADVQKLAIRLLEEGLSSPALYELAGTPAFALDGVGGVVDRMFDELGDQLPTREEATLLLAQQIADETVNGRIEPEGRTGSIFSITTVTWTGGWRRRSTNS